MNDMWIQVLTIIVSNLIVILTFFGITISLHLGMRNEISQMKDEVKDFHGRLCKIEESKVSGNKI